MHLAAHGKTGLYNLSSESFTYAEAYACLEQLTGMPRAAESAHASIRGSADRRITSYRYKMDSPHRFGDFVRAELQNPTLS